jgi:hypothetical protein
MCSPRLRCPPLPEPSRRGPLPLRLVPAPPSRASSRSSFFAASRSVRQPSLSCGREPRTTSTRGGVAETSDVARVSVTAYRGPWAGRASRQWLLRPYSCQGPDRVALHTRPNGSLRSTPDNASVRQRRRHTCAMDNKLVRVIAYYDIDEARAAAERLARAEGVGDVAREPRRGSGVRRGLQR